MREHQRSNLIIFLSLIAIALSVAIYSSLVLSWLHKNPADSANSRPKQELNVALVRAREQWRERLSDAQAALSLSEALYHANRPIDGFSVESWAKAFYGLDVFEKAHALVVLRREDRSDIKPSLPEIEKALSGSPDDRGLFFLKADLTSQSVPADAIALYARIANADPSSFEGRQSLQELQSLASIKDDSSETALDAREALQELLQAKPDNPFFFTALAMAQWERGDLAAARALVSETLSHKPNHAGALMVSGAIAWTSGDTDYALKQFSSAFEKNPDDLYSAEKLAEAFDKQGLDREAALPYYLAIYRQRPDALSGSRPLSDVIREILAGRNAQVADNADGKTLERLLSPDASLRERACARAGLMGDEQWLIDLKDLLDDDVDSVRRGAAFAALKIAVAHPRTRATIKEWLTDNRPLVSAGAFFILNKLDPGSIPLPKNAKALPEYAIWSQEPAP